MFKITPVLRSERSASTVSAVAGDNWDQIFIVRKSVWIIIIKRRYYRGSYFSFVWTFKRFGPLTDGCADNNRRTSREDEKTIENGSNPLRPGSIAVAEFPKVSPTTTSSTCAWRHLSRSYRPRSAGYCNRLADAITRNPDESSPLSALVDFNAVFVFIPSRPTVLPGQLFRPLFRSSSVAESVFFFFLFISTNFSLRNEIALRSRTNPARSFPNNRRKTRKKSTSGAPYS